MHALSKCATAVALLNPLFLKGAFARRLGGAHGGDPLPCACERLEADHAFDLDCSATQAITDAFDYLAANNCGADDGHGDGGIKCAATDSVVTAPELPNGCVLNYMIVQAHHDYCPEDSMPTAVELGFHTWQELGCLGCAIKKKYDPTRDMCPGVTCADETPLANARLVINDGCGDPGATTPGTACCTTAAEKMAWQTTRAYHDTCEHTEIELFVTAVEEYVENAIHEYEEFCEAVECNIATATEDQLTCPSPTPAKKDDKKDEVDALLVGAAIAIGVAVLAMGMAIKLRLDNRSLQAKFSAFMEGGGAGAGKPGHRV